MTLIKEKQIFFLCAVLLSVFIDLNVYAGDLIPGKITIRNNYKSSSQPVVGKILEVAGQVIIIHSDNSRTGYKAAAGFDIYEKDTIITQSDGRIIIVLSDGSTVNIAADTRLVINESVYKPREKLRSSFLTMLIGKAHFIVKKLPGYNKSRFEVKTKTAVVGVRGSEFIIESLVITIVTTFGETELWAENPKFPEERIKVGSFMQTTIGEGTKPTDPVPVLPVELEKLLKKFFLTVPKKGKVSIKYDQDEQGRLEKIILNKIETIEDDVQAEDMPGMNIEDPEIDSDIEDIVKDAVEDIEDIIQDDISSDITIIEPPPETPDQDLSGGSGTGGL